MKKLLIFLLAVAALVLWLYFQGREPAPPPAQEIVSTQAVAPAGPPASLPPQPPPPVGASGGAAVPPGAVQRPAAQPPSAPMKPPAAMENVARANGVRIVAYERTGATARVTVEWSSDVMTQGMDFIEGLRRQGVIRDFEADGKNLKISHTSDGRRLLRFPAKLIF